MLINQYAHPFPCSPYLSLSVTSHLGSGRMWAPGPLSPTNRSAVDRLGSLTWHWALENFPLRRPLNDSTVRAGTQALEHLQKMFFYLLKNKTYDSASSESWMWEPCVRPPPCWLEFTTSAASELLIPTWILRAPWRRWRWPPYSLEALLHRLTSTGRIKSSVFGYVNHMGSDPSDMINAAPRPFPTHNIRRIISTWEHVSVLVNSVWKLEYLRKKSCFIFTPFTWFVLYVFCSLVS